MILSELIQFLKSVNARPKKSLSQNFLIDLNIIRKIVQLADVQPNDTILEIGPGPGALTAALLNSDAQVYAVEMDTTFARELHRYQNGKLTVIEADFLKFPLESLPKNLKVVANLPYHITTPILEKLFAYSFSTLTIMVQKEVAQRMASAPGTKDFGSLSLFVQFYSKVFSSFKVPASCFYPHPKIDSTVIRLDQREPPKIDPNSFFPLVHKAFQQRRKMVSSSLAPKDRVKCSLAKIGVSPNARPENISLDQWVAFALEMTL